MYKIVIIGCGLIAMSHVNAIKAIDEATLVGVCDVVEASAKRLGEACNVPAYTDCEAMLQQVRPDVAIIAVPTYYHKGYAQLCAKYRVNVLCEKPLERTIPDSQELIRSVEDADIVFMTAQVVRFWPGYVQIKKMVENGEVGQIYMAHLRRASSKAGQYGAWLFKPELGGGAMHDMLVHDVDFLRYLCGPFESCYANAAKDETGCYNHVMANILHKNGIHAVAEATMTMQTGYPFSFFILLSGSEATVEYRFSAGATIAERGGSECSFKIWRKDKGLETVEIDNYDVYEAQLRYFLDCCARHEQPQVVPHQDSLDVIRMIDHIHQSADTGRIWTMDEE